MSKYPVKYPSASKGEVEIETMATPHLANAWRKMVPGPAENLLVLECMRQELVARGCTLDTTTLQWTFPEKPEVVA